MVKTLLQRFVSWKTSFHAGALKSDLSSAQVMHSKFSKDMKMEGAS